MRRLRVPATHSVGDRRAARFAQSWLVAGCREPHALVVVGAHDPPISRLCLKGVWRSGHLPRGASAVGFCLLWCADDLHVVRGRPTIAGSSVMGFVSSNVWAHTAGKGLGTLCGHTRRR